MHWVLAVPWTFWFLFKLSKYFVRCYFCLRRELVINLIHVVSYMANIQEIFYLIIVPLILSWWHSMKNLYIQITIFNQWLSTIPQILTIINNHLSPQFIEHKKKTTTYCIGNPSPSMGQVQKCDRDKPVNAFMARCIRYNIKVCQWLVAGQWFSEYSGFLH